MSIPLVQRAQCTECAACTAWTTAHFDPATRVNTPRHIPTSPQEPCMLCGHSWLTHLGSMDPNDRNFTRRRGPCATTRCGGFISPNRDWDDNTPCVCGAPLYSHAHLSDEPSVASLPAAVPPPPPLLGFSAPPIAAFQGVPAVVQGTAGTRCLQSIGRTLNHGPFAAATAKHSGPRHNYPRAQAPSEKTVQVMCWPNVWPQTDYELPGYPAPPIKINNTHAKRYATVFKDRGLAFELQVAAAGPTSVEKFSQDVAANLQSSDLAMPPCPDGSASGVGPDLDDPVWALLKPSLRNGLWTFGVHPTINDNTFGCAEFHKLDKKFPNPTRPASTQNMMPTALAPWIFIAPRFGPICGSVGHILAQLPPPPATTPPPVAPQRPVTPQQSLVRQRSPGSQAVLPSRRVRQRPADPDAPVSEDEELPVPPPHPPLIPLRVGEDVLHPSDVVSWVTLITLAVTPLLPEPSHIYIKGKTVRAVGACLIDLLPDFLALQRGFNIIIKSMGFAETIRNIGALPFLIAIYDRRIKAVPDLSNHLRFSISTRAADLTTPYFAKLFEVRLQRYMEGVGHPHQVRFLEVSDDDFMKDRYDPLLRANLILAAGSGSDMCPTRTHWSITFRFHGNNLPRSILGTAFNFHTCFYAINVFFDRAMQDILLNLPGEDDGRATNFDTWVHSQFLNRELNDI
ncbi:hypothetical protein B0H17DRAFT_1194198 [Mycena rosella]|uniref:Uncharacterized protein n=1 Tax=Mycena rosella TaxID=1033263 RepID=A0AAD7GRK6_MYCRO|nr:hypothetical protein B0H17DRAFT_1194198 [Mycena rosella]